ncbi:aldehyde dehydrogenase (NADP(+)) [Acinetobacter baumannii]|nr:aldehyde dehydrogenase (NADP(+)) [Acinetobacter baumannii]MCT2463638.1 aldehyde dehydrogenase (NADP(+)) [Acinetobacter baumannii]
MVIGHNFIGGSRSAQGTTLLKSIQATTGEALPYEFHHATEQEINQACEAASQAFKTYRHTTPEQRAVFLENIADELDALGTDFLEIVSQETALPLARLQGERARTSGQMRLFAKVLRRGDFLGARIDTALPERQPLPRPDLRQIKIGVGPVAVFGASNFPLAFSTAGGDTASALAAGCSVVVKAHSGHMATADFVAQAIERAVEKSNMPKGVFNMIYGNGVGEPLVKHPLIQAVGFTGSLRGGRALCDMAAARPQPIPVFAEMSSINPMLMLPEALKNRGEKIAQDLADSVVLGCGQFCTNPGLILGIKSAEFSQLINNLTDIMGAKPAQTMLNAGTLKSYTAGLEHLTQHQGIKHLAGNTQQGNQAQPQLLKADVELLLAGDQLLQKKSLANHSLIEVEDKPNSFRHTKMNGQ